MGAGARWIRPTTRASPTRTPWPSRKMFDDGPFSRRTMMWLRYGTPVALLLVGWIFLLFFR